MEICTKHKEPAQIRIHQIPKMH